MSFTDLTSEFDYKDLLTASNMDKLSENDEELHDYLDDGWIRAESSRGTAETWTYATASTFTISGDKTSKYQVGDKIKLTQTTVKYFYIVAISYGAPNTTVTVSGGSDYTVANAAITSPYFSKADNPQGFPDRFNFDAAQFNTAYFDNGAGGQCANRTSYFRISGKTVEAFVSVTGTKNTTSGYLSFNPSSVLPARLNTDIGLLGYWFNGEGYFGYVHYTSSTDYRMARADNSNINDNQMGSTYTTARIAFEI